MNNKPSYISAGDKCDFGKHRGYTYTEIYQFEPSYIVWLIENKDDFIIEPETFERLPNPTPYSKRKDIKIGEKVIEGAAIVDGSNVYHAKEFLKKGGIIPEVKFKFSRRTLEILKLKSEGKYLPPDWERKEYEVYYRKKK